MDKLNKILVTNAIAVLIISVCSAIVLISAFHPIPHESRELINKFFDMCLVGVVGWAFNIIRSKQS